MRLAVDQAVVVSEVRGRDNFAAGFASEACFVVLAPARLHLLHEENSLIAFGAVGGVDDDCDALFLRRCQYHRLDRRRLNNDHFASSPSTHININKNEKGDGTYFEADTGAAFAVPGLPGVDRVVGVRVGVAFTADAVAGRVTARRGVRELALPRTAGPCASLL